MKLRLLALLFAGVVGVTAGPLPHAFAQNYTQHMALLDAYPMDHPIWISRMGERELKVCFVLITCEGSGTGADWKQ